MLNSQPLNTYSLNYGVTPPAAGAGTTYSDTSLEPYRLQLHDHNGDLLAVLNGWVDGTWERKVNEPEVLTFVHSVVGDDSTSQAWGGLLTELVYPNFVYLFEGDSTTAKQKFRIMETEYTIDVGGMLQVKAYSILEQLGREIVTNYSTQGEGDETDPGKTVTQVVQALLAEQAQTLTVSLKSIAPSVRNQVFKGKFENKTILQCLKDLISIYGGYITTDNNRRLTWSAYTAIGEGHRINLDLNAIQIRKRVDYTDLANVVLVAGYGTTNDTRILANVNDPTSIGQYGVIATIIKDQSVTSAEAAEELAEKELERRKQPRIYYDVDAIDLSKVQNGEDFAYEANAFTIGQRVRIIGREIEFSTHIQSIEVDLVNPAGIRIEVSNPDVGTGLDGLNSVDSTDNDSIQEIVAEIADLLDDLQGDRGELESVRKSLDPIPDDLTAVMTWDTESNEGNMPEKIADALDVPYGDIDQVDDMKDGIVETVIDAINDPTNPNHGGIVDAIGEVGTLLKFAQIQAVFMDHLECIIFDQLTQTTTGGTIYVAKPYLLQQSPYFGETITYIDGEELQYSFDTEFPEYKRTHNNGIETGEFYITPNYYIGEIIMIAGIYNEIDGTGYDYIEVNSARHWAQI
jgi:hypothetical protein